VARGARGGSTLKRPGPCVRFRHRRCAGE
jgi:hypothetical protein